MSPWGCEVACCRVGGGVPSSLLFFPFGKCSVWLITAWVRGSLGAQREARDSSQLHGGLGKYYMTPADKRA